MLVLSSYTYKAHYLKCNKFSLKMSNASVAIRSGFVLKLVLIAGVIQW
ncbi:hypothetical protein [Chamaesiphon minutus]|nr:hypothetical protein [Chamaesiphon minutus]